MKYLTENSGIADLKTKKAAKLAGYRTQEQWFKKFRAPLTGENPIVIKGEEYFLESQTEELFSKSKGKKEIGRLADSVKPVGNKRLPRSSVRYDVYRESDFVFEPKREYVAPKITPPRNVDLLEAIAKIKSTAEKFILASKSAHQSGDGRRGRGFRNRANNLLAIVELGLRRAIVMELVQHIRSRGKTHHYATPYGIIKSTVKPPNWFEMNSKRPVSKSMASRSPSKPRCRLKDAIYTIEQFKDDPTLYW